MATQTLRNNLSVRQITEIAVLIAFATALELAASFLPRQPQGGSVSISLIPIIVLAYRHGLKIGILSGLVFGLINWMLVGFVVYVHWFEGILDYILAYGVAGFSALIFKLNKDSIVYFALGAILAGVLRYFIHFLSGILIFDVFTPDGVTVWWYSLTYNGAYMLPTIGLLGVLAVALFRPLKERFQQI